MPKAWIENGAVRDIAPGDPFEFYHPDVAVFYDTEIPHTVERGWSRVDGVWTAPPEPPPPEPAPAPLPAPAWTTLTPAQFVGLFTFQEEATMTASEDQVVQVFIRRVYMPALTQVERDRVLPGLDYLVEHGYLTLMRRNAILAGDNPE
jgi:hypothetical protein